MNNRILIYVVALIIAGFALYLWNSSENKPEPQSAADIDSVAADNRPSISEEEGPLPPEQRLSPGTALVKLKIKEVSLSEKSPVRISATVEAVLGYGSSTPVLGQGTKLQFAVDDYLDSHPKWKKRIQKGEMVQAVLSYRKAGLGEQGSSGTWHINTFVK